VWWCEGRALLRLKPSRRCANRGYYERYVMPHILVNALRARLLDVVSGE
jgi:hypothetical protein